MFCVIIGFCTYNFYHKKIIFSSNNDKIICKNINAYLVDAPNIIVEKRNKPICDVPLIGKGSQFIDGGYYVFNDEQEKNDFLKQNMTAKKFVFEYCNADGYLNNKDRKYCLCLKNCQPEVIKENKGLYERVMLVKKWRENNAKEYAHKLALKPTEYYVTRIPKGNSVLIPVVSSENRKYIPMGFLTHTVIYTNATAYIDDAQIYHFGVLTSNVHMAWMRAVAGRLEMRYRYSTDIVYNNFPWCQPTDKQKAKIEATAQAVLDARAKYPDSSLADLYDELTMPADLRKAHQANDKAVWEAYGKKWAMDDEAACVAELMKMYQKLVGE